MNQFNVERTRKDFPNLNVKIKGKNLVYFDNAATTLKPRCVIKAINKYYSEECANTHRGIHYLSNKSTYKFEQSREKVKNFINAKHNEEIIFTYSATHALNLLAYSLAKEYLKSNDQIIISYLEHHSNLIPWQIIAKALSLTLKVCDLTKDYILDIDNLQSLISSKVKLIVVTYASNVLGSVNPIEDIIDIAHKHKIKVIIDATQYVPHGKIDVQKLDCDFLVFSGHKMYAPFGVGVLYGKKTLLEQIPVSFGGGGMNLDVSIHNFTSLNPPYKFEAGTYDVSAVIALYDAIDYLNSQILIKAFEYEKNLLEYAKEKLININGIKMFCSNLYNSVPIISFALNGIHSHDIATILDEHGIAIRAGYHCAKPLIDYLNINSLARVSFAFYNTKNEIDYLVDTIKDCQKILL